MKGLKWIFFSLILFISFAFTTSMTNAFADEPEKPITIQVVARFSESDETKLDQIIANYADEITVNVDGYEDIEFAYWILNNKIRNFPKDHKFIATENQTITALFAEEGYHVVVFINANGDVLKVDWVEDGKDATAPDTSELSLPGYVFDRWDKELTGITSNTIVVAQYEKVSEEEFELTVVNGKILGTDESTDTIGYNEVVTVVADDAPTGKVFSHWQVGHRVVSTQPTYKFTMLQDLRIEAVYANEPMADNPLVTISRKIYLNDKPTYYGQFYLPEGYTRIEYGFIMSDDLGEITLETPDIEKKQILNFFSKTNEFIITFSSSDPLNVRTYLVYKDTEGNLGTVYSDLLMDLFISEYGEGSANNKWIEIYNPFDYEVDLTPYSVKLFSNGSTTPENTLNLTNKLQPHSVYVIYNSNASNDVKNRASQANRSLSNQVANFNGNDVIGLYKNDILIDVFGILGDNVSDTVGWEVGNGSTVNHTIVRKTNILSPTPIWNTDEWDVYAQDTFDYIGFHKPIVIEPASIDIYGPTEVMVGDSITLIATVFPEMANQEVVWSSSNPEIATVDENGVVTGVSAVEVTEVIITATSKVNNEVKQDYTVTILPEVRYSISIEISGEGTVVTNPTDSVLQGKNVVITVTSSFGYEVEKVLVNDIQVELDDNDTYTVQNVQTDLVIIVSFKSKQASYEEQLVYYTGFEDVTKQGYSDGEATSNGKKWILSDALIEHNHSNDKKVGNRSVRLRLGYIQTLFATERLTKIEFQCAVYGSDQASNLSVLISTDANTWVKVYQTSEITGSLQSIVIVIDYNDTNLQNANITLSSKVYVRIEYEGKKSSPQKRVNIDEFKLYSFVEVN